VARQASEADADQAIAELARLGIQFADADWQLSRQAASFKAQHRMSLADCFAAALAKHNRANLVTGDREFEAVSGGVRIDWLI
jgi:predicted nucleic acid-binding protein